MEINGCITDECSAPSFHHLADDTQSQGWVWCWFPVLVKKMQDLMLAFQKFDVDIQFQNSGLVCLFFVLYCFNSKSLRTQSWAAMCCINKHTINNNT